jgi:hypothetical protein
LTEAVAAEGLADSEEAIQAAAARRVTGKDHGNKWNRSFKI